MTKLARFYIKLEGIRSFIDGNGRTGRLLINLELMKTAICPSTSSLQTVSLTTDAFDVYHVKHDLSAMEKLFARYINERLDLYLSILQEA